MAKGMPAAASASASSPPRPKMKGSPPLSRTTAFPARASRTSVASMSLWAHLNWPPFLPAKIRSQSGRVQFSTSGETR